MQKSIGAALRSEKSELVIANICVVDVFSQETFTADVAINDGVFVGIGEYAGHGIEEIDGTGKYLIPGLIDAHVHIESTLVTPREYANVALARGITGAIADPHEIANVAGVEGIRFMIESSRHTEMDIYFMLPSCVPATAFENSGAVLPAGDLRPLYGEPEVLGLAEVMDFPAVFAGDPDMSQKLADAMAMGARIDGHMAGFTIDQVNGYGVAGIATDHECDTALGLKERVRRGIYTFIREGTVCKDLVKMVSAVTPGNAPMLCFATDDKHLDDLVREGGVDASVRMAIGHGLDPAIAIQMGSLNVARCFKLDRVGGIAPGYRADCVIVADLQELSMEVVFKNGRRVAREGCLIQKVAHTDTSPSPSLLGSVTIPQVGPGDLEIVMEGCRQARIMEVVPGTVVTNSLVEEVLVENDRFVPDASRDHAKIAVIERHRGLGSMAVGIVKGLSLCRGAIATTIAHDSHNLIVAGTCDNDMLLAIETIRQMQGGIVVVDEGRVAASLQLEIGGLMTGRTCKEVLVSLNEVGRAATVIAPGLRFNPFLALSFMSLVVIPHLKLCDSGLFDFASFTFVKVPVEDG